MTDPSSSSRPLPTGDDPVVGAGSPSQAEDAALAAIVRSSQMAVISKTVDGTITAWNDGATLVYGYAETDVVGRNIAELIPGGPGPRSGRATPTSQPAVPRSATGALGCAPMGGPSMS